MGSKLTSNCVGHFSLGTTAEWQGVETRQIARAREFSMGSRVFGPSSLTAAKPAYSAGGSARAPKPTRRNGGSFCARANYDLAIILAAISLGGCRETHAQDDPRTWTPLVEVTTVQSIESSQVAFTGIVEARVQNNLGFRVPGKVIQRLSFATSSLKNRCKLVQHVPSPGPGRLIAEPDGSGFAGSPPKAKIASARRHHS
jgi:hypothetical protein